MEGKGKTREVINSPIMNIIIIIVVVVVIIIIIIIIIILKYLDMNKIYIEARSIRN
jgi:heme/copper-type cytochrome/quinol oxidase subunit 2